MVQFNNWESLLKHLELQVITGLETIGEEAKDYLKKTLLDKWYESHNPTYYIRTNNLIDSISVTKAKKEGNSYEVLIYFDDAKILPEPATTEGFFPAHMNITNGEFEYNGMNYGQLLPLWVEEGQNSIIHSYDGVHMVQDTKNWLLETKYLKNRMIELLSAKGYKCV